MTISTPTAQSLATQYAAEHAAQLVPNTLKAIKQSKRFTIGIMALVMVVTYFHGARYLNATGEFWWFAWIIPAVFDLSLISAVITLMTVGLKAAGKRRAAASLVLAGLASFLLQIQPAIPGPILARIVFGTLVVAMLVQKWAGAAIAPDFTVIEHAEAKATAEVPNTPTADELAEQQAADQLAAAADALKVKRALAVQKGLETKRRNREARAAELAAAEQARQAKTRKPRTTRTAQPAAQAPTDDRQIPADVDLSGIDIVGAVKALPSNAPVSPAARVSPAGVLIARSMHEALGD